MNVLSAVICWGIVLTPSIREEDMASAKRGKHSVSEQTQKRKARGKPFARGNTVGNRFVKGQSGNPGGRPKILSESYREYLATLDETTGRTRAQDIARAMGVAALGGDVSAAREIRAATEGDRIRTWRDDVIDLLKAGTVTPAQVETELGAELARELFVAAGVRRDETGQTESGGAPTTNAAVPDAA